MPNVAIVRNILARTSKAMTQNWQQMVATAADRDGVFLFNTSASSNVPYRLVGSTDSDPSGAGSIAGASGILGPYETRFIAVGSDIDVFAYAVTGTDALIMEETA